MTILEFLLLLTVAGASGAAASGAFGLVLQAIGRQRRPFPDRPRGRR